MEEEGAMDRTPTPAGGVGAVFRLQIADGLFHGLEQKAIAIRTRRGSPFEHAANIAAAAGDGRARGQARGVFKLAEAIEEVLVDRRGGAGAADDEVPGQEAIERPPARIGEHT